MKRVYTDTPSLVQEFIYDLFFKETTGFSVPNKIRRETKSKKAKVRFINDGTKDIEYYTFDPYEYNGHYIEDLLVSEDDRYLQGVAKLQLPPILFNQDTYVMMTYDKLKRVFIREDYSITKQKDKKGIPTQKINYDKRECHIDHMIHTSKSRRNPELERHLTNYNYFKKVVLPRLAMDEPTSN